MSDIVIEIKQDSEEEETQHQAYEYVTQMTVGLSLNNRIELLNESIQQHLKHTNQDMDLTEIKRAFSNMIADGIVSIEDYDKGHIMRKFLDDFLLTEFALHHPMRYAMGLRFGVQFTLFGYAIMQFGTEKHHQLLQQIYEAGELACFAFTEKRARAVTGAIVESTCKQTENGELILNGQKMWIGQGWTAKWAIVLATLILKNGDDKGPQWFIVNLEEKENLPSKQVVRTLMPESNNIARIHGMDWAYITFNDCILNIDSMLDKYAYIDDKTGEYICKNENRVKLYLQQFVFERIGLSSGLMNDINIIMNQLEDKLGRKLMCHGGGFKDNIQFTQLPFFRNEVYKIRHISHILQRYLHFVANQVINQIANDKVITNEIDMNASIGKIITVEYFFNSVQNLKMNVGAYSLGNDNVFNKRNEFGFVVKCIGGDNNLLTLKLMRYFIKNIRPKLFKKMCVLPFKYVFKRNGLLNRKKYECDRKLIGFILSMRTLNTKQRIARFYEQYAEIKKIVQLKAVIHIYQTVKSMNKLNDRKALQTFEQELISRF